MMPPRLPPTCSQISPLCGNLADTPTIYPVLDTTKSQQVSVDNLSLDLRKGMTMDEQDAATPDSK